MKYVVAATGFLAASDFGGRARLPGTDNLATTKSKRLNRCGSTTA
jgi:hypothetical protein